MSRISNYNSTIMDERVLPHDSASIKNNVVELLENNINCILLFLSTSITDVNDIVPTVINDLWMVRLILLACQLIQAI